MFARQKQGQERGQGRKERVIKQSLYALVILMLSSFLAGCTDASTPPVIKLSSLQPLATPPVHDIIPLRVSVAALISPRGTISSYQPLLDYLSEKLKRPVELVQRRTYAETNLLVKNGEVDLAFVCTSAYLTGHKEFDMQLLVAPQVTGVTTYNSLLIVPANSPVF